MARQGLRTLCFASREITNWNDDIDPQDILPEEIECDLHLLCVTGVEDLLQDDVKSCIEDFRHAGISVWMLTGDKGLTAQEIGVSCGLISQEAKEATEAMENNETVPTVGVGQGNGEKKSVRIFTISENDTDVEGLFCELKDINELRNDYKKYQVVISGVTIALVLKNESLHDTIG
jgi:magnesium-transporting ATPase (P-type)